MPEIMIIQLNSYLFTWKLNNPEANYKVSGVRRNNNKNITNKIHKMQFI
jgi:hypothetical protein